MHRMLAPCTSAALAWPLLLLLAVTEVTAEAAWVHHGHKIYGTRYQPRGGASDGGRSHARELHGMSPQGHLRRYGRSAVAEARDATAVRAHMRPMRGHAHAARTHLPRPRAPASAFDASSLMAERQEQMGARASYWSSPDAGLDQSRADAGVGIVADVDGEAQRSDVGLESGLNDLQNRYDDFGGGFNNGAYNDDNAQLNDIGNPDDGLEGSLYKPENVRQALLDLARELPDADNNAAGALNAARTWANYSARGILEARQPLERAAKSLQQKLRTGHEAVRARVAMQPGTFEPGSFAEEGLGQADEFPDDDGAYPMAENARRLDDYGRGERFEPAREWRPGPDDQIVDEITPDVEDGRWY